MFKLNRLFVGVCSENKSQNTHTHTLSLSPSIRNISPTKGTGATAHYSEELIKKQLFRISNVLMKMFNCSGCNPTSCGFVGVHVYTY